MDAGVAPSGEMSTTKFPSLGLQILSSVVQILGVYVTGYDSTSIDNGMVGASILAHFVSRRVRFRDINSFHGIKGISWTRFLILLAFIDS